MFILSPLSFHCIFPSAAWYPSCNKTNSNILSIQVRLRLSLHYSDLSSWNYPLNLFPGFIESRIIKLKFLLPWSFDAAFQFWLALCSLILTNSNYFFISSLFLTVDNGLSFPISAQRYHCIALNQYKFIYVFL